MKKSVKYSDSDYTCSEFYRELAWRCGDGHANRICKLVDAYCWLFNLSPKRFYERLPR